jgi:predicted N-acetyltransferase YhbS
MEKSARSRSQTTTAITIRPMNESDVPELLRLMRAIVSFERGQNFSLDEAELLRRGFGERPEFGAYVADAGRGSLVGIAVHYEIPFMHTLQPLLMLKWLYVDPEFRGGRVGQRLMRQMALRPCERARALLLVRAERQCAGAVILPRRRCDGGP